MQAGGELSWENPIAHEVWSKDEVLGVKVTHVEPKSFADKWSLGLSKIARFVFDKSTGYKHEGRLSPDVWLRRLIFLETIAGVPGMVRLTPPAFLSVLLLDVCVCVCACVTGQCAGMLRHLRSLRRCQRDHGWIHTLLEEAENERMHLLTFLRLRDPGPMFRLTILVAQGVFFNAFFVSYLVSPHACHRFVGYIEEEAVKT